jgi:hypothetical protein
MLLATLLCAATLAGGLLLLDLLFTMHARRYNTVVATDVLNAWASHLEHLDPATREQALLAPPASVVAAMTMLPSKGSANFFTS